MILICCKIDSTIIASVIASGSAIFVAIKASRLTNDYQKHSITLENDRMQMELFQGFNNRYDKLNDDLYSILEIIDSTMWNSIKDEKIKTHYEKTIIDWFNLCAEEHYWWRKGRISNKIWESWKIGIDKICKNFKVQELWKKESAGDGYRSYYLTSKYELFNFK